MRWPPSPTACGSPSWSGRGFFEPSDVAGLLPRRTEGTWAPEQAMRIWTLAPTDLRARAYVDGDGASPATLA